MNYTERERFRSYVVVDLETGGLNCKKNPIVEIGMVVVQFNPAKNSFSFRDGLQFVCLLKPYGNLKVEDTALKVNKIPLEKIKNEGEESKDVFETIISLVEELNPQKDERLKPILVGHNIDDFDLGFLEVFFRFHGTELTNYFNKTTFDTYKLAGILFVDNEKIENLKLSTVCNYLGIKSRTNHRAMADVMATAFLWIKIANLLSFSRNRKLLLSL